MQIRSAIGIVVPFGSLATLVAMRRASSRVSRLPQPLRQVPILAITN